MLLNSYIVGLTKGARISSPARNLIFRIYAFNRWTLLKAHLKQGIPLAPGMEIGYVVKDAGRWEVEPERTAAEFDAGYYGKLLEKAWEEVGFVFGAG